MKYTVHTFMNGNVFICLDFSNIFENIIYQMVRKSQYFIIMKIFTQIYLYICLVCLFDSNRRQNGWTDRDRILFGISHNSKEGLWIFKISKISIQQNSIFIKF